MTIMTDHFKNPNSMETIEILLKCVVEGHTVKLPNIELDADKEYRPVKKALERIGGKWNSRAQGFVFEEDPTELLASIQRGEPVNIKKDFQFFATPVSLANYLVSIAYDKCLVNIENPKILEPSAGDGALVKAIVKHMPDQRVDCFELMELNRIKLQKVAGTDVLGGDFLEAVAQDTMKMITEQYDLIIANPPFTKNQDIDHIRAMYKCLKPGGVIVTIASPSWTFGQQKKQTDFKEWLENIGATTEEVAAGQFKESGTNVSAVIITLQKPVDENSIIIKPKEEV
ncbi:class I SAM-dependent methyltransferase, partial [bacterium]